MNLEERDLPFLDYEAEFERHGAARKVAGEFGLEDCFSVPMSNVKRCDCLYFYFVSAFHSLMAASPAYVRPPS